jgi:hypothetical protein
MRTDEMLKVEEIVGNLAAENERLRAVLMEIRDNGYRAALCHAVAKTALEQKSP